jgi:hypothetical protein
MASCCPCSKPNWDRMAARRAFLGVSPVRNCHNERSHTLLPLVVRTHDDAAGQRGADQSAATKPSVMKIQTCSGKSAVEYGLRRAPVGPMEIQWPQLMPGRPAGAVLRLSLQQAKRLQQHAGDLRERGIKQSFYRYGLGARVNVNHS